MMIDEEKLPLTMNQIEKLFQKVLGEAVVEFKKEKFKKGLKGREMKVIWMRVERENFLDAIRAIAYVQIPHLSVTSGSDMGDFVELIYHFHVNYGYPGEETSINLKVHLPKNDLTIPTITEIVPGAITTEREKQEFLGITVKNIPDSRRLWLDENYPKNRYPWRWDEKGMEGMSRYIHDPKESTQKPTSDNPRGGDEDEK